MARLEDIDETVDRYLKTLLAYYRDTDPAKGPDEEFSKHAMAEHAIEVFWYLHGKLMSWAQAHMTGYAILSENPGLVEFLELKLGLEIDEDSHVLEQIGLLYNYNPPDDQDPDLLQMQALLEEFGELAHDEDKRFLDSQAIRRLIVEIMMSRSADNSYWRHPLQYSLKALNDGEHDTLSTPLPGKRQGQPFSLARWKQEALRQVYFRIGAGMKKYRALEEVGAGIGQSPETLRAWEKELRQSLDRANDLYCSELAGKLGDSLKGPPNLELEEMEDYGWHRGVHSLVNAKLLYDRIKELTLDEIREHIRRYREKKTGS